MIHRLRVRNFKSLIDVAVDLSPVTVFVGKSGTGKSNFVESLRFLREVLSSEENRQIAQQRWSQLVPATQPTASMHFEVEFSIAGIGEPFRYLLSLSSQGPLQAPLEERLTLGRRCLFHQTLSDERHPHSSSWLVEPDLLQVPKPGAIALGRIPSISEVVIAFTALTSGIGCYVFPDTVLCSGGRDQPMGAGQNQRTIGLDDGASNYLDILKEIVINLQDLKVRKCIVDVLQQINPSVASVELNDIQQPSHVVVGHKFDGKTLALQLSQESGGFRRVYCHLLALYQQPPKQTLVFEHPEDGIHPGALSLLAEEFKSAPLDGRGQILLTTHSPRFLNHFDVEQIRVVELDGAETRIGSVSVEQQEAIREELVDPGELLTVDPARMQPLASEATGG